MIQVFFHPVHEFTAGVSMLLHLRAEVVYAFCFPVIRYVFLRQQCQIVGYSLFRYFFVVYQQRVGKVEPVPIMRKHIFVPFISLLQYSRNFWIWKSRRNSCFLLLRLFFFLSVCRSQARSQQQTCSRKQ